ncbi:endoribonuclease ysh1 [Exophiala xenobiotica]|uniref:Endoribonuclease ysh1 n=1 Tax=Lithohypha guttulata TaxID=1690604 RepID=A0ABR0KIC6_9EURO|nr:endoribonuclease ysh1 [Lithohypha guttulata]KAK5325235.1 endoribonuclease ysh1 [Exophiala xenobiotica]
MAAKRKAAAMSGAAEDEDPIDPSDELTFTGLGGCQEVGRSCHILQYKGKTVMLDAGMHTGREGMAAMPYFDDFDLGLVDILLISHFHLDHAAALPYVLAKTNFRGRVFMTHPTKAIYKWLIQDSVRVSNTSSTSDQRTSLYTEADHISTLTQIETIDFYTTHTINGVQVTPYPAGHVLGAAMFLINIAGLNIFFTGDYSTEQDRHLVAAAVPDQKKVGKIDLLISESTFGISTAPPREEREFALLKSVTNIVNRGGKVLLPVFALGRAQELLLILEDYWQRHPELQKTPIYYTGNTARKCMVVYQTYINAMNDNIKRIFRERMAEAEASGNAKGVSAGPWDFRFVRSLRSLDRFDDVGSCVMLASPGMLQSGMSRILLERWAPDQRNGVVMTGYNVEGTMGRTILSEPDQIPAIMSGNNAQSIGRRNKDDDAVLIPRRCSVEEFSFAAHVTGKQNIDFIEAVRAPHIILVHGEKSQAARLKSRLLDNNSKRTASNADVQQTKVYSPENGAEVKIPFRKDKIAKVVGRLAQTPAPTKAEDERVISGVIVQNGFKLSLMAPEDLKEYAGLTSTTVLCKQHITLSAAGIDLIKWALEGTFGAIEEVGKIKPESNGHTEQTNGTTKMEVIPKEEQADEELISELPRTFLIMGCIALKWSGQAKEIELEWEGNTMNDGIADAVMAVLTTVESSPAAVKYSSSKAKHHHHHSRSPKSDESREETAIKQVNGTTNGDHKPLALRNQLAYLTPEERFSRLCMFLEEQFGDNITPIETPRISHLTQPESKATKSEADTDADADDEEAIEQRNAALVASERARLAAQGIPVPGLEIKVDKMVARLWLDDLTLDCASKVWKERIMAVVERAVETVAPLWSVGGADGR